MTSQHVCLALPGNGQRFGSCSGNYYVLYDPELTSADYLKIHAFPRTAFRGYPNAGVHEVGDICRIHKR
jgi:hypothetical protein